MFVSECQRRLDDANIKMNRTKTKQFTLCNKTNIENDLKLSKIKSSFVFQTR